MKRRNFLLGSLRGAGLACIPALASAPLNQGRPTDSEIVIAIKEVTGHCSGVYSVIDVIDVVRRLTGAERPDHKFLPHRQTEE